MLIILGLSVYKDYGVSWDEPQERTTGIVNLAYIGKVFHIGAIENSQALYEYRQFELPTYFDRVFGVGYQLPILLLERALKLQDDQAIYFYRHLVNYLVCLLGLFAIFRLSERRYQSWKIGLFTATLFLLSPRFFAESFYNVKDLIFLSFFAISVNSLVALLERPSVGRAIMFAFFSALAIDVRLMAIMLPMLLLMSNLTNGHLRSISISRERIIYSALSLVIGGFFVVAFWPWLWSNPFVHFFEALRGFSAWTRSDIYMLFNGSYIRSTQLPWYYALVWIGITTPVSYLIFFVAGLYYFAKSIRFNHQEENFKRLQDIIFISCIGGPIFAVITLKSVIYDGWRHLYFIYPYILLVATGGFIGLYKYCLSLRTMLWRNILVLFAVIQFSWIAVWMIQAHPMQNLYFNSLVGKNWKEKFDLDYWGLSGHLALRHIAAQSDQKVIKVWAASSMPLYYSLKVLDAKDRDRFQIVNDPEEADFFISNYRGNTKNYEKQGYGVVKLKTFSIRSENYLEIYKRIE